MNWVFLDDLAYKKAGGSLYRAFMHSICCIEIDTWIKHILALKVIKNEFGEGNFCLQVIFMNDPF